MSPDCFFGLIAVALAITILLGAAGFIWWAIYWWDEFLSDRNNRDE